MANCPPHSIDPAALVEARKRGGTVTCDNCHREFRPQPAEVQLTEAEVKAYAEANGVSLEEATLKMSTRKGMSKSDFAIPEKAPGSGSYPIHDKGHAVAALRLSSGKPEESRVRAAVKKKYPTMGSDSDKDGDSGSGGDTDKDGGM